MQTIGVVYIQDLGKNNFHFYGRIFRTAKFVLEND